MAEEELVKINMQNTNEELIFSLPILAGDVMFTFDFSFTNL